MSLTYGLEKMPEWSAALISETKHKVPTACSKTALGSS